MPLRDTAPLGAPCWIDLMTSDKDASRAFYSELFGWTSEDAGEEYGHYVNFSRDGVQIAGCMDKQPDSPIPDIWSVYLATADADATVAAIGPLGGQTMFPVMDVMDLGRMSMLLDPGGAAIGIWQPGPPQGVRRARGAGCARLVRAAHPELRRLDRVLPRGVRLGPAHHGRHAGVPLLHLRRG